jgi:hypothetical protein
VGKVLKVGGESNGGSGRSRGRKRLLHRDSLLFLPPPPSTENFDGEKERVLAFQLSFSKKKRLFFFFLALFLLRFMASQQSMSRFVASTSGVVKKPPGALGMALGGQEKKERRGRERTRRVFLKCPSRSIPTTSRTPNNKR